ncbi:MAG: hypothetical protein IJZ01_02445 [Paraprevotella sp.]|nr:hypothetical protein [Paraprevotella sp.]
MRSIEEIKQEITATFVSDEEVRKKYGLSETDTFEGTFSKASIESLLFHTVATCAHVVEQLIERHRTEVEQIIHSAVPATLPWWHAKMLQFRDGYPVTFDTDRLIYRYSDQAEADREAAIIAYASVIDEAYNVKILLAKSDSEGLPTPLTPEELTRVNAYIDTIKPAGTVVKTQSTEADEVRVTATVLCDPLVFNADGTAVATGEKTIEQAISHYLRSIDYGGTLRRMHMEDAIQTVEGVKDVAINKIEIRTDGISGWTTITSRYTAQSGAFRLVTENNITYEV